MSRFPKIRPLSFQPMEYEGEQLWLLQDPERITEAQLLLPPLLAQMTVYCDGRHDIPAIYNRLAGDAGFRLPPGTIEKALEQLDEAFLLENKRYRQQIDHLRRRYRAQPFRPMTLAGLNYAAEPRALADQFAAYEFGDDPEEAAGWAEWTGRGIISPHIDYQRGGPVYARTWRRAVRSVAEADLVLMFATDHSGGLGSLTLTKMPYQTPYGLLPTDELLVDRLAQAIGEESAYRLELNHRFEHSVELSAVWLHHAAQAAGRPAPPMVPLLIGSFHHFVHNGGHPAEDPVLTRVLDILRTEIRDRRVLCVASVDLSHVGPAFGDDYCMDADRRAALRTSDERLMEALAAGDDEGWYREIAGVRDRNKVCGFSPIYLMLRCLGDGVRGHRIAYDHCPADAADHSLVSICGMLLD